MITCNRSLFHTVSCAAIVALTPAAALAQSAPADDRADQGGLAEIVVTAQKRAQSLQDVPISVSVASAETLSRTSIRQVKDLPRLAPALTYSGGSQPSFRTLLIRGIGSYVYRIGVQPAVSTVVDGVPLARSAEGTSELGDVERVEVLSGPQGTLFGRNSTGGIVNITRVAPSSTFGGYVNAEIVQGEQGDTQTLIRGAVNTPITDGIRLRLFGFNQANSSFVKNHHPTAPDSGKDHVYGFQGKLAVDITPDVDITFSGDYMKDNYVGGTPEILVPIQSYQQPNIPNVTAREIAMQTPAAIGRPFHINAYLPYESTLELIGIAAQLNARFSESLVLRSITSYRDNKITGMSPTNSFSASARDPQGWDILGGLPSSFLPSGDARLTNWHYFTQEARLEYSHSMFDAVAGVYYFKLQESELADNPNVVSAQSIGLASRVGTPTGPATSYPYYFSDSYTVASSGNKVLAGFADVTVRPTAGLELFGGYRHSHEVIDYDYYRQRYSNLPIQFGTNFSQVTFLPTVPGQITTFSGRKSESHYAARAGASYELTERTRAYFSYSHGYVGAGVDLGNGATATAANPAAALLRPSITNSYEIGFKSELFDRRLRLNVTAFKAKTRDVQVTALVPGTNINVVQNAGNIDAKGVEVNFDAQLGRNFNISGGMSYLDADFQNLRQPCYPNQPRGGTSRCQPLSPGSTSFDQSVAGLPAINAPKFKFNIAATYTIEDIFSDWNMYIRPVGRYQTKVYYQLDHDPFATQGKVGMIDLTLGFTSQDDKFDLRFFVNNLTDKYYCPNMNNSVTGRQACLSSPIDAQRRFGASFQVNF